MQRTRTEEEMPGRESLHSGFEVIEVIHLPAVVDELADLRDLTLSPDTEPVLFRDGQVIEVQGVLRGLGTSHAAGTAVDAALLGTAVYIGAILVGDRQWRVEKGIRTLE